LVRALRRQEAGEEEAVAGQAGNHQTGERGRSAGQGDDRQAGFDGGLHQLEPRVGDEGGSRVAHQGHRIAMFHGFDKPGPHGFGVVIVIGDERPRDAVGRQQLSGHAGVLAGHPVDLLQEGHGAQGDICEVADWRGDDIKPGKFARRFTSRSGLARLGARRSR
jgi:hypothetical protein